MSTIAEFIPTVQPDTTAYARAMQRVSQLVKGNLRTPLDEITLAQTGVSPAAVEALAKSIMNIHELEWIIKRRTLSHRKQKGEMLTPDESDRWLRAAKICSLAQEVFGNNEKANAWLRKQRKAFNDQSAILIMQTEAGAKLVEETLNQIDSGYF